MCRANWVDETTTGFPTSQAFSVRSGPGNLRVTGIELFRPTDCWNATMSDRLNFGFMADCVAAAPNTTVGKTTELLRQPILREGD